MSLFEKSLLGIIAKATKDYETVAKSDPIVKSTEDGTVRGDMLDVILAEQRNERKELWDKLYQLEAKTAETEDAAVFAEQSSTVTATPQRKYLSALMYEYRDLSNQYDQQVNKVDIVEQPNDTILEIEFREQLDKEIEQYKATIGYIKEQLQQTTMSLRNEKAVLAESKDVYDKLKVNEQKLLEEQRTVPGEELLREKMLLKAASKRDTEDLIDFLETYFPPHPVDNAGPLGDECELKIVLEQLMNHAYASLDDPYIELEPGTYYSPYIQTLLKGGIIKYHPEDSRRVRLNDFNS